MYIHRILSNMFLREQNTKLYEFFPQENVLKNVFFNIKFRKMFCHQKSHEKWWIILKSLANTQPVFFVKSWPWKQYKWKIQIFLCFQNVFWKFFWLHDNLSTPFSPSPMLHAFCSHFIHNFKSNLCNPESI